MPRYNSDFAVDVFGRHWLEAAREWFSSPCPLFQRLQEGDWDAGNWKAKEKKGEIEMGTKDAKLQVTVEAVDKRLIVMPACPRSEALLKITKMKFINPVHLGMMRDFFGVKTEILKGAKYLKDKKFPEVYRRHILNHIPTNNDLEVLEGNSPFDETEDYLGNITRAPRGQPRAYNIIEAPREAPPSSVGGPLTDEPISLSSVVEQLRGR